MTKEAKARRHYRNVLSGLKRKGAGAKALKAAAWMLKETHCRYCLQPVKPLERSIDHRTPRILGGKDEEHNYAMCHRRCNNLKGGMRLEDYDALTQFLASEVSVAARFDIERRLLAGGRIYRGR